MTCLSCKLWLCVLPREANPRKKGSLSPGGTFHFGFRVHMTVHTRRFSIATLRNLCNILYEFKFVLHLILGKLSRSVFQTKGWIRSSKERNARNSPVISNFCRIINGEMETDSFQSQFSFMVHFSHLLLVKRISFHNSLWGRHFHKSFLKKLYSAHIYFRNNLYTRSRWVGGYKLSHSPPWI